MESYGIEDELQVPKELNKMEPSMERFYGALLFVDISGFTGLAQKLDVESLKNHINDYFTKMLNVIDKWEGDVIKFAGDALYIVWRVEYNNRKDNLASTSKDSMGSPTAAGANHSSHNSVHTTARDVFMDNHFIASAKSAVERAVSCALEINACCCNHTVLLGETSSSSSAQSRWSKLFNSLPIVMGQGSFINNGTTVISNLNNTKVVPMTPSKGDDKVAYLNVHSGVGFGLLAGVDVGCRDRWEFFLLGEPISQVANAESLAQTGDVVISEIAHSLIHQFDSTNALGLTAQSGESEEEQILSCGCCRMQYNYFRISKNMTTHMRHTNSGGNKAKFRRSKSKAKFDEFALNEALQSHEEKLYEYYAEEIEGAFGCIQELLKKLMLKFLEKKQLNCRPLLHNPTTTSTSQMLIAPLEANNSVANSDEEPPLYVTNLTVPQRSKIDRYIVNFINHQARDKFYIWISKCLIDDLVKHAHEAARGSKVEFFNASRLYGFQKMVMNNFEAVVDAASGKHILMLNTLNAIKTVAEEDELDEELNSSLRTKPFNPQAATISFTSSRSTSNSNISGSNSRHTLKPRRSSLVGLRKTVSQKNMIQDASSSAEMRTVTVLFVKIDGLSSTVSIDDSNITASGREEEDDDSAYPIKNTSTTLNNTISPATMDASALENHGNSSSEKHREDAQVCYDKFYFLQRSSHEAQADSALLSRLQACMEVLVTAFASNGGHLRQFIIDDKGTVCIGTFGLRGSVAGDNAAAALETAKRIIIELQAIDLTAAIGITSGKAYCGIVGSPTRHEYAVMGPSVNLSARLMCQAMACTVICDSETKSRDRSHAFEPLKEVIAKGYVQPVMTYKPVFVDLLMSPTSKHMNGQFTKISEQAFSALSPDAKWQRQHRQGFLRSSLDAVAMESFQHVANVFNRDSFDMDSGMLRKSIFLSPASTQSLNFPGYNNMLNIGGISANGSFLLNNPSGAGNNNNKDSGTAFTAIVDSEFYIQRKKGSREFVAILPTASAAADGNNGTGPMNNNTVRLYGREKEISQIIEFLFLPFTVSSAALLQAYHNVTVSERQRRLLFEMNSPCRLLVVTGNEGLGKSALANSVAKKLVQMTRQGSNWNLAILKNKSSTLHSNVPFYPWIFIIQDMLLKVYRQAIRPGGHSGSADNLKRMHHRGQSIEQQMQSGLMILQRHLSDDTQQLLPLLGSLNIIPTEDDNDRTQYMQGRSRYLHSLELLFQLLQVFPTVTNRLVFVVLEKLSLFDPWSLSLLHRLWKHGKGFTFLVTYSQLDLQSNLFNTGNVSMDISANYGGSMSLTGQGSVLFNPKGSINYASSKLNRHLAAALATATGNAYIARSGSSDGIEQPNHVIGNIGSSRNSPIRASHSNINVKNVFINNRTSSFERFFLKYWDDPRFSHLELKLLEQAAVINLVRDTLHVSVPISDPVLTKVYELSGGNPLYAFEIANSINASVPALEALTEAANEEEKKQNLPFVSASRDVTTTAASEEETHNKTSLVASKSGIFANDAAVTEGNTADVHHVNNKVAASLEQILAATSNRIEEVICYRFDQLPHLTQIMLKAAAVICSNGAYFTTEMLLETLSDSTNTNNDVDRIDERGLMQALAELVLREEFLEIVHLDEEEAVEDASPGAGGKGNTNSTTIAITQSSKSSRNAALRRSLASNAPDFDLDDEESMPPSLAITPLALIRKNSQNMSQYPAKKPSNMTVLDQASLKRARFGFRVVLEQITLYNLLVLEKKEKLHDAVASFYYRRQEGTVEALLEEAFHWQHAMVWAHALSCYYKAAMKLWEVGDYHGYQQQLQAAFRIYYNLRSDVGITQTFEVHLVRLKYLFANQHQHRSSGRPLSAGSPQASSLSRKSHHGSSGNMANVSGEDQSLLSTTNNVLSTELIHEMCYSDSETLSTILQAHIRTAQFNILTLESPLYTTLLLEEGLQLLLLSQAELSHVNLHNNASEQNSPTGSGKFPVRPTSIQTQLQQQPESKSGRSSPNSNLLSSSSRPHSPHLSHPLRVPAFTPRSPRSALYSGSSPRYHGVAISSATPGAVDSLVSTGNNSPAMFHNASSHSSSNNNLHQQHHHNSNAIMVSVLKRNAQTNSNSSNLLQCQFSFQHQRFKLQDYVPIHLSLYGAFIHMYTWAPTSNPERLQKAELVQSHFSHLTKKHKKHLRNSSAESVATVAAPAANPVECVHYIQALAQTVTLHIRYTQLKEAWICGKKLMRLYSVEDHNAGIVSSYGVDICNFLLSLLAQQLFFVGDIQHGAILLERAIDNWKQLAVMSTNANAGTEEQPGSSRNQRESNNSGSQSQQQQLMYSMHLSFLPICACLMLFHRYEEAIAMVDTMSFLDGSSNNVTSSLALLPQVYKTDVKSILVLQMKLVEGLLANNPQHRSSMRQSSTDSSSIVSETTLTANAAISKNSSGFGFTTPSNSTKNPKRPSIRASMFLHSSSIAGALIEEDVFNSETVESTSNGDTTNHSKRSMKSRLRRSLNATENYVLPPTLAADEEYAPKKQSYLSHLMFISGMASEAIKIDVELLKFFSSPTDKELLVHNPSTAMHSVAAKYEKLAAARNPNFDGLIMSELWPLITLMVLFRRSNYVNKNSSSTPSNRCTNEQNRRSDNADENSACSTRSATQESNNGDAFLADRAPDVPRPLIKVVIALAKRCEQRQYFLACAILGAFLSEMQVPVQVQEAGEKVKRRAFDSIRQVNRQEKYEAFEESFRLIVKGDFCPSVPAQMLMGGPETPTGTLGHDALLLEEDDEVENGLDETEDSENRLVTAEVPTIILSKEVVPVVSFPSEPQDELVPALETEQ